MFLLLDRPRVAVFFQVAKRRLRHPKRFVRHSPAFDEITLHVFYLDGHIQLDQGLRETVNHARRQLPGIRLVEMTSKDVSGDDYEDMQTFHFNGFPSVGATFKGRPIFRQQGLLDGETLVAKLREAAPICVAIDHIR